MKTNQHCRGKSLQTVRTSRMAVGVRCLIAVALLTSLVLTQGMGTAAAESPPEDTTPPTVTTTFEPEPNEAGWHASAVTVNFNWHDDETGINGNQCDRSRVVDTEGAVVEFGGGCTDNANNGAGVEGVLKIDMTPPETEITSTVEATVGSTQQVTVEFGGTDALSGVASYLCAEDHGNAESLGECTSPVVIDGVGTKTFSVAAIDTAGNADPSPATLTFELFAVDTQPPAANPTFEPAANAAGWHADDVTVSFNWYDGEAGSGIDTDACSISQPLELGEGADLLFGGGCKDHAGNVGEYLGSVSIDKTAPDTEITARPRPNSSTGSVRFEFNGTDAVSGIGGFTCDMEGPLLGFSGRCSSPFVAGDMDPGEYTFRVAATDVAGNIDPTPASFTFTVGAPEPAEFQLTKSDVCIGDAITWQNTTEDRVRLQIGTKLGGKDIINVATRNLSYTVTEELPVGAPLHAALLTNGGDQWTVHDRVTLEPCATVAIPDIAVISPSDGEALCAGDTIIIAGPETGRYRLRLGTSAKGRQIANVNVSLADGYSVGHLPGATSIHATLYHRPDGGRWSLQHQTSFPGCPTATVSISTHVAVICTGEPIMITGPGTGRYRLRLGTTPDGAELANATITARGYVPDALPTTDTIYASLRHRPDGGAWTLHHEITFNC